MMQTSCEQLWKRCLKCVIDFMRLYLLLRSFRDLREYLERKGFVIKMPDIIPPDESQLSDTLGNNLRLVIKIMFVVEVINGHFKICFAYFYHI